MFQPDFICKSDRLQLELDAFRQLVKKTREIQHLTPQAEVILSIDKVLLTIGLTSIEQLDQWFGEINEICAFIHNGEVVVTRCE